jgi:hypothetical protein
MKLADLRFSSVTTALQSREQPSAIFGPFKGRGTPDDAAL